MGQNYSIPINQKHPELVELNAFYESVHLQRFPAHSIVHKRYSKLMRTVMFSVYPFRRAMTGSARMSRDFTLLPCGVPAPLAIFGGRIAHYHNKTQPSLLLKVCS